MLAKVSLTIVVLVFLLVPHTWIGPVSWLSAIPLTMLSLAFLVGTWPKLLRFANTRFGTLPLIGLHAILLPVCIGLARQTVATAMTLPPQSFDVTVALIAVLLVPALWCVLVAATLIATAALSMLVPMSGILLRPFASLLSLLLETQPWANQAQARFASFERRLMDHAVGAIASFILIAVLAGIYAAVLFKPANIRLVAYALDFSEANGYPGIEPNRRMRLLDNGYIAYAERHGLDVVLQVVPLPAAGTAGTR
ncbi:MAG: hypothetical protein V4793_46545 [Paraburkholderia tropica]|uniref:hypothetical protein n=1 Tax=Burkholderia gladioli TaxID=28095 RepID=UPI000F0BA735|nr:hypothetical protein [Burkholderia gladioli]